MGSHNRHAGIKFKWIGAGIAVIVLFAGWFLWKSYDTGTENAVRGKVVSSLKAAIEQHQEEGERTLFEQPNSLPYYVANFNDAGLQAEVLQDVLFRLNGDKTLPPVKLSDFRMRLTSSLDIHVTVSYTEAFGMKKRMAVSSTVRLAPFKHPTGPERYG